MSLDANKILTLLFAAYPVETRNIPGDQAVVTARVYARMLADLDQAVVIAAIERLIKTSERLPTVARIRAVVVELQYGPRRAAGDAWGEVRRALGRWGAGRQSGRDFTWDDPIVGRVVDAMGWNSLAHGDNPTADRARFCEMYDQLAAQERDHAQAAQGCASALLTRAEAAVSLAQLMAALGGSPARKP